MPLYTPGDFKKYFWASCILSIICLIGAIVAIGSSAYGDVIEQSIRGTGDFYTWHDSEHASDLASAVNATVIYDAIRTPETFSTSFIVSGAQSSGGYRNQYVVKSSGAGYKHVYRATAITGDFVGSGEVMVTVGGDGAQSLDSLILMDSRAGNATFQGRIYNGRSGKPVAEEEMDAIGKFVVRSYLNITEPIKTSQDWLQFCNMLDLPDDAQLQPV